MKHKSKRRKIRSKKRNSRGSERSNFLSKSPIRGSSSSHAAKHAAKKSPYRYTEREQDDFRILLKRFAYALEFDPKVEKKANWVAEAYAGREENFIDDREDLREELIFTIDGEDARDHDDAVSLRVQGTGKHKRYTVGVHIADVSYFVEPESLLDKEALKRGTSVYVLGQVLPMFPKALSNGICSLSEGAIRLTVSGEFVLDHEGTVKQTRFFRSVIKSRHRLTYPAVQSVLDGESSFGEPLDTVLKQMEELSQILLRRRLKAGALDLETYEQIFEWEYQSIASVFLKKRLASERIIEELMLLMNREVAHFLSKRDFGIFRVHEMPDQERLSRLKTLFNKSGIRLSSAGVENPLAHREESSNQFYLTLRDLETQELKEIASQWILLSMKQAQYACECKGHYGLAFKHYTHFTSPIRRYPDLLAHRLLINFSLPNPRRLIKKPDLCKMAQMSNVRERKAIDCEREYRKIKSIRYMGNLKQIKPFTAFITGIHPRGHVYVRSKDTGIEGMIHRSYFYEDFMVDATQQTVVARENQASYGLGAELIAELERVEPASLRIYLRLIEVKVF